MRNYFTGASTALLLAGFLTLAGCGGGDTDDLAIDTTAVTPGFEEAQEMVATAMLEPTEGNTARGTVTFTQVNGTIRVEAEVMGLAPGEHGFHIHENGDCSNNAEAAGGHFAGEGTQHGAPDAPVGQRHVGDFGNITAGDDSTATFDRDDSMIAFTGTNNIVGRAVVVHAGADDLQSQPSGDSGARVACGVIEMEDGMMQGGAAMTDTTAL